MVGFFTVRGTTKAGRKKKLIIKTKLTKKQLESRARGTGAKSFSVRKVKAATAERLGKKAKSKGRRRIIGSESIGFNL